MVKVHAHYDDFAAVSQPFRADAEIEDVEIEGEIPKELDGTFYRVLMDPYYDRDYYLSGEKSTPFDGDGSISAFRVKDGKVPFQQRYVMTERLVAERKAGASLFSMLRSPFSHHPCVRAVADTPANTNVILHAGKLLALCEHGPGYELDPHSLRTIGHDIFPGQIHPNLPFTAHPHVDPDTGDLIAFGYGMRGLGTPQITVYSIDQNGKLNFQRDFKFHEENGGIIHDCAITKNYIILMRMPYIVDLKDIEKKGNHQWYYNENCPAWFGVIPRNGHGEVRWFKYRNCMAIHTGASWEENGKIYFDASVASHNAFSFLPCRNGPNSPPEEVTVTYVKWCIDPNSASNVLSDPEVLVNIPCEFPRVDERFLTKKSRITFLDCFKPDAGKSAQLYQGLNALARVDYETHVVEFFVPGPDCLVQEPAFSPRSPDAEEGDGFLITMVDNMALHRNEVIIQDTRDFQKVVAKIILPFRLSLHNINFIPMAS
ncbi:cartenoid oxygenase, putative [Talaromyces stipitatus ATCC 10500]|uniref:Cartenoid oxygenase, putative n=1 Tax=Talaromyces stipitatus (strain ATCC 10500 / CBS 375.48 / QM 6759 / NRRL 1006) TaxID=441959 RepID=B8MRY7_TALSN|nr:cartenoid oxygenase, putative [Talaromyces stipitatus ATCC 10500]EED13423.1 cartenoid oxygenase, putative [Talaromyces stipitatus ATCC 10500]